VEMYGWFHEVSPRAVTLPVKYVLRGISWPGLGIRVTTWAEFVMAPGIHSPRSRCPRLFRAFPSPAHSALLFWLALSD